MDRKGFLGADAQEVRKRWHDEDGIDLDAVLIDECIAGRLEDVSCREWIQVCRRAALIKHPRLHGRIGPTETKSAELEESMQRSYGRHEATRAKLDKSDTPENFESKIDKSGTPNAVTIDKSGIPHPQQSAKVIPRSSLIRI